MELCKNSYFLKEKSNLRNENSGWKKTIFPLLIQVHFIFIEPTLGFSRASIFWFALTFCLYFVRHVFRSKCILFSEGLFWLQNKTNMYYGFDYMWKIGSLLRVQIKVIFGDCKTKKIRQTLIDIMDTITYENKTIII